MNRQQLTAFFILILLIFSGCIYYPRGPEAGVTDEFVTPFEIQSMGKKLYDFSKLDNGYGLVLFSYHLVGKKGIDSTKPPDTLTGFRVWEHRFLPDEPATITVNNKFKFWPKNSSSGIFDFNEKGFAEIGLTYINGGIVYAGRIVSTSPGDTAAIRIENHFREDCSQWLATYRDFIKGKQVDTDLMDINRFWTEIYEKRR